MESSPSQQTQPPDPTPPRREQYLFLLEFFIHRIDSERLGRFNEMFYVPTTVTLNFLNLQDDSIEITPVDPMFEPLSGIPGDSESFFSGRSILFAIPEKLVTTISTELKISLKVQKKMPEEIRPDILVGTGELDMSAEFAGLRKEILQCWHRDVPPPKSYEGPVELFYEEEPSGTVSVLVRISGFGQSIVTEFDSPPEETATSFVFRGDERDDKTLSYKCRIINPSEMNVCEESEDDAGECGVCLPKKTWCMPCGQPDSARINATEKCYRQGSENQDPSKALRMEPKGMITSSRGSPMPCGKAVVLKVSGLLDYDGQKKPTVTVESESSEPDPEHDVFVLRIGKKGLVGANEKSDLQLEMRTPKGPERRPPIRYETREAQTEVETKEVKKKGKAKGKGKGKKKK
ncbi:uncharacterized protein LOC107044856 [Diachasma alloeum]|uniref:uncharacterized protein LOC107044856 n=1 Tax=Diachasma alloeum TaxID=454923 RepID=UPI0007384536|nr:uncharacterized protein LOC107044856 [Diachasma alloeum]